MKKRFNVNSKLIMPVACIFGAIAVFFLRDDQDALTDGLLILRYLFGLEGSALTNGVVAPDAPRTSYEIETYLKSLMPAA